MTQKFQMVYKSLDKASKFSDSFYIMYEDFMQVRVATCQCLWLKFQYSQISGSHIFEREGSLLMEEYSIKTH